MIQTYPGKLNLGFGAWEVNKIVKLFLLVLLIPLINNCSLSTNSKIWSNHKKIYDKSFELLNLTKNNKVLDKEYNIGLKINLIEKNTKITQWNFSDLNLENSVNHIKSNININKISKVKFNKIGKFKLIETDLLVNEKFIIFRDDKGSIIKFDKKKGLSWSANLYSKKERKNLMNISLALSNNKVFVTDNLGKYYALNLLNGDILWKKNNNLPFNSELKVKENKLISIDTDDVIHCYSTKDGTEIWNFKTSSNFIKVLKRSSLVVLSDDVIFSNSIGDITKINLESGELIWQIPTLNTLGMNKSNFLKMSEIVVHNNSLMFSNNNNEFYSLSSKNGVTLWKKNVNSSLRPVIIDDKVFSITRDGFLIVINANDGETLRITSLLNGFNDKIKIDISFSGFVIAKNEIYITTNHGHLLLVPVIDGKIKKIYKISNSKLSEPIIVGNSLYAIKNDAIILLN